MMFLLLTVFAILFQHTVQVKDDDSSYNQTSNYSSLETFKKILSEFISNNGGIESLGKAAGSAYNRQYSENRYPFEQQGGAQNIGQQNLQNNYYHPQSHYGYYQNGHIPTKPEYGEQSYGQGDDLGNKFGQIYGSGYAYGDSNQYQQNNFLQQNYVYGPGGNVEQTQLFGQDNYGHPNYGYGQGHYGQLYQQGSQAGYLRPGSYPINGYPRPESGLYSRPQGYEPGFLEALTSITRHDDLRCVPRLLCEVASSGKSTSTDSQASFIPFANKESLVSLLTVLNFVDDSPLMTFGRAALLGYTARGDTRACLQAYPTCPRDPDRLIEYLNNHNGGFFRFFQGSPGQNIPQFNRPYYDPQKYPLGFKKKYRPQSYSEGQYSPLYYNQYRILTKPEIHSSISSDYTFDLNDNFNNNPFKVAKKLSFPKDSPKFTVAKPLNAYNHYLQNDYYREDDYENPTKGYLSQKPINFFPDRTGTGDLLLDYNQLYSHNSNRLSVPSYATSNRNPKQISFPDSAPSYNNYNKRMIFPF